MRVLRAVQGKYGKLSHNDKYRGIYGWHRTDRIFEVIETINNEIRKQESK